MSPSDIGIVAFDVVPSLIILDAAHGSLKGRQSENAQVGLAWAVVGGCLVLCHDALAQNKSVKMMYVLVFFVMYVVLVLLLKLSLACHLAFFLLNISAIMAFTSSPTCTKFL